MTGSHRRAYRAIRGAVGISAEPLERRFLLTGTTNLVFDDEFNQAVGSLPNPAVWDYNTGTDPNNGGVDYTDTAATMSVVADSSATDGKALAMTLTPSGNGFVSARINTSIDPVGGDLEYGEVSARIKMPGGPNAQGIWPAFWMLGSDINTGTGWPLCGETDIVEMKGSTPTDAQGSLHAGSAAGGNTNYDPTAVYNVGSDLYSAYHVYAVNWTPTTISFSVDGFVYETQSLSNVPSADKTPFNKPFYIILNICEGGSFAGGTNGTQYTVTAPTTMYVDYVRAAAYNLPAAPGLSDADIGSPGVAGSAAFDGTGWTVAGSGGDIWNTSDQFNFDSQTLTGDGSITAEVTGITNSASFAKAGVMIRNGTAANAAYAFTFVNPNDGVSGEGVNYEYRSTAGASSVSDNSTAGVTAPEWVRLVRAGNTFTAYDSADGITWTQNGTPLTIAMGAMVNIGLAVSANTNSALDTATFTHVSILQGTLTDSDIGSPNDPGSASFNSTTGVYTVVGNGADIWNAADQFNLASEPLTGDGSVVAYVTGIGNTNTWAKAGVMLRNDDTAGSLMVNVDTTVGQGVTFQYRNTANAVPTAVTIASIATPIWVKVTRAGNNYSGYYSSNGTTWTQIGTTQTLSMNATLLAGLAVSSHDNYALTQATFTNVAINSTPFAALNGSVLDITFQPTADPISLDASSNTAVSATENGETLSFTGVNSELITYATAGGTLTLIDPIVGPMILAGDSAVGSMVLNAAAAATLAAPAQGSGISAESLAQLSLAANAVFTVATPVDASDRAVLILGNLAIAESNNSWQGRLDLTANDMILLGSNPNGATLAQTTNQLAAGYSGGSWNGPGGIMSSSAAAVAIASSGASTVTPMALGVMANQNSSGNAFYGSTSSAGTFDGQSPGAGAILVKYTQLGDADLAGSVTSADYLAIDNGYAMHLSGWFNGDFNYDGAINGDDYSLLDNSFNSQTSLESILTAQSTSLASSARITTSPAAILNQVTIKKASSASPPAAASFFANGPAAITFGQAMVASSVAQSIFDTQDSSTL